MKEFEPLYKELDEWNFDGEEAMFWWRDDDAVEDTPALQQLLSLSTKYDLPVALAAIPELLQPSLADSLKAHSYAHVLQHGVCHKNHAPASEKKQELSRHADIAELVDGMSRGFEALTRHFDQQFIPVMVPPWNRIDEEVVQHLADIGFMGLSCFSARQRPEVADNIWLVNSHVDIINWKSNKAFIGTGQAVTQFVAHLSAKRSGAADRAEPTGLMTHHLVHDQACQDFLTQLFSILDEHPAATWLSAERVFQTRWRDNHSDHGSYELQE